MEMPRRDKPRHAVCEDGRARDYLLAALKAARLSGALSVLARGCLALGCKPDPRRPLTRGFVSPGLERREKNAPPIGLAASPRISSHVPGKVSRRAVRCGPPDPCGKS